MNLAIQLNEDQQRRLDEIASRLNVPPAILVEAAVRDLVDQSEADFERVSKRLLEKNRELYKRLR